MLMSIKSLKTPLRYPGGKSRACVKMDQFLPDRRPAEINPDDYIIWETTESNVNVD